MWGDEPQLQAFRERLRLLLDAHQQELNPKAFRHRKVLSPVGRMNPSKH